MVDDHLPESVDVIVIGTGLPESILAAACARSGLSVLHLDRCDFYGGNWSSFNLHSIDEWGQSVDSPEEIDVEEVSARCHDKLVEGERLICLPNNRQIFDLTREWTEDSTAETTVKQKDDSEVVKTLREVLSNIDWRRFSIDIAPKALLSRGSMVQTLCDSEVSRYAEFKCIDRLLCVTNPENTPFSFARVPFGRSEIFGSEHLSLVEKRKLMKFMQFCLQWNTNREEASAWKEYSDKPFTDFLSASGVDGVPQRYIAHAIGILHPNATTEQGLTAVCKFIDSVNRFGPSPFLFPLYGCGELPQCFCRLCAVYNGLYCLGRRIDGVIVREENVVAVIVDNQRVNCSHLFLSPQYTPTEFGVQSSDERIERAILITKDSIWTDEKEHLSLVPLADLSSEASPRLFEAGHECCLAPKGYFVSHITSKHTGDDHIERALEKVYARNEEEDQESNKGPRILYKIRFNQLSGSVQQTASAPSNFAVLPPPNETLDYANVIEAAHSVFSHFWPDRDFLPRILRPPEDDEEHNAPSNPGHNVERKEETKDDSGGARIAETSESMRHDADA